MSSSDRLLLDNFWHKWLSNRNRLYLLCHTWTKGDTAFTEDILSETLLHTCKKYEAQGNAIRNFDFWIKTVTFNIFLQIRRRHKRQQEFIERSRYLEQWEDNIHQQDPQSIVFQDHYHCHFHQIILLLPEKLHAVMKLYVKGLDYKKIAQLLNISEANVRKRVQLAKDKIYTLVNDGVI